MPSYDYSRFLFELTEAFLFKLDSPLTSKPASEQQAFFADLQIHAGTAGLKGLIAAVWEGHNNGIGFLASSHDWDDFFTAIEWTTIVNHHDGTLRW